MAHLIVLVLILVVVHTEEGLVVLCIFVGIVFIIRPPLYQT